MGKILISHVWVCCYGATIAANPSSRNNQQYTIIAFTTQLSLFYIYHNINILLENYIQKSSILRKTMCRHNHSFFFLQKM